MITKNYVNRYTRRLYKFLDQGHRITFRKMKKDRGEITTENLPTELVLDPRDQVISTLIHETLHYFYPEAPEKWIIDTENKIIAKLTNRQVKNIIQRLAKNISTG